MSDLKKVQDKRSRSFRNLYLQYEPYILGGSLIMVLILGTFSLADFYDNYVDMKVPHNLSNYIYQALRLFALDMEITNTENVPWHLDLIRFVAPMLLAYTVIKSIFYLTKDKILEFQIRFYRDHIVVCGLGNKAFRIVSDLLAKEEDAKIIIIDQDASIENLRKLEYLGVSVLIGNATDDMVLEKSNLSKAKYLIAATGNDETNLKVAFKAEQMKMAEEVPEHELTVFTHLASGRLVDIFKNHSTFKSSKPFFEAKIFNIFDNTARMVFETFCPDKYTDTLAPTEPPVHLLLIGLHEMGEALMTHYARTGHFYNLKDMEIAVVDFQAQEKVLKFKQRYPDLESIIKIESKDATPDSLQETDIPVLEKGNPFNMVFIAMPGDESSLFLATKIRRFTTIPREIPIVCLLLQDSILPNFYETEPLLYAEDNIFLIRTIDQGCNAEVVIDEVHFEMAKKAHQNYINKELAKGDKANKDKIKTWKEIPISMKEANIHQIDHLFVKVRALGCEAADENDPRPEFDISAISSDVIEQMAEVEHERWNASRWLDGWRLGKRDNARKLHDNLVGWEDLTDEIKQYDRDTILNLPMFLRDLGKKMVKK